MIRSIATAALAAFLLAGGTDARAETLALAVPAPVTSIDPHYHTLTPNESLDSSIFERLVEMDPTSHLKAGLAESWKLVDDHTWEFKLRAAKFHDGAEFTSADVAYTIGRIPRVKNSPASFQIYTRPIVGMEIVDPRTIRLRTAGIYPLLPTDLTQVFIIPHGLGADPATEDFNNGRNAIGTGPYRFVSYRPGDRTELERFDGYWGTKPRWQHITYRVISNDAARTAALLACDVGFIEAVPTSDAASLAHDSRVKLAESVSLRIIFLTLDQSRDGPTPFVTGPNGEILAKNPLKDLRVRQALSLAINRAAIVDRVMEGAAIPAGQFLPPGSYSYVPDLPPPAYDPAKARALLAEAGYPDGLRMTIHGPNDRYVNDARIIQTVAQMWSRIGVRTAVDAQPWTTFIGHANKQDYSAYLLGWGSSTGEASNPLRSLIAAFDPKKGFGAANRGRYDNPAVDALTERALATADDAAREELLRRATRMAMEDVAFIPLHNQKNIWATRANLTYTPRADEETRAQDVR